MMMMMMMMMMIIIKTKKIRRPPRMFKKLHRMIGLPSDNNYILKIATSWQLNSVN